MPTCQYAELSCCWARPAHCRAYGSLWAVVVAQILLLVFWKTLPQTRAASVGKLGIFAGALLLMGLAAYRGVLPRTRPIVPGELMIAD